MRLRKIPGACQSADLDDELVMISAETGLFFATKDVGPVIWAALDGIEDLDLVCDHLVTRYDVTPEECRAAVLAFAGQLVDAGFAEYVEAG